MKKCCQLVLFGIVFISLVNLLSALVCYSCNQGENPSKCGPGPMNETIGIKKAKCPSVNATCVTLINANDNNNTYRDCSDNFWLSKAVIDPMNANTCVLDTYSKRIVCNCQSDLCNTGSVANPSIYHINECTSSPCQNGGVCRDIYNRYECICGKNFTGPNCEYCKPGLTGVRCDILIDMCKPNRCLNGGTCNGGSLDYNCTCLPGYTGYDCEIKIDPCASSPCVNGGVCYANTTVFAYWCDCYNTGFKGPQCAVNVNECTELAPSGITTIANCNNGTCVDLVGTYRCDCDPGFTGTSCFIEINECETNPCVKGTCVDRVNEFKCNCFPGYGGVTCNENVNECTGETCSNHGTCTDLINRFECMCDAGYTGVNCEIDINECLSYPCQNGGTCSDEIGLFNCSCKPGYTGRRCEIDIDECAPGPCKNGATCLDQLGKYSCICTPGYTGQNCTVVIDQCEAQSPCYVGGSTNCSTLVNDFVCTCKQGYTGKTCGTMINYCKPTYCLNGGTCVSSVTGPKCVCDEVFFTGPYCHIPIARCDLTPSPCKNNGTCSGGIGTMPLVCTCPYPFTDPICSTFQTICQTVTCKNGGTCVEPVPGQYKCQCPPGFSGLDCSSQMVDYCIGVNCTNGVCISDHNEGTYKCKCEPGFSGQNCDQVSFKCTGPGLFADPAFCWHYHKCQAGPSGFTKTSYECPKKSLANDRTIQLLYSHFDQICVFPSKFNGSYPNRTCKTTL